MEIDTILNMLLSMGVPGVILAVVIWLAHKFVPKAIDAYKTAKESEQQAFHTRQREYRDQSEKSIEVATSSAVALENAFRVIEQNTTTHNKVISTLNALEISMTNLGESFKAHDRRSEEIHVDVKKILEHARKRA